MSSSVVDRRQDVLDAVLGRRRVGGVGHVVGVAQRARTGATSVADAGAAGRGERRGGRAAGSGSRPGWRSSLVAPDAGLAGRRRRADRTALPSPRPFVPFVGAPRPSAAAAAAAARPPRPASGASTPPAVVPTQRAVPTAGLEQLAERDPEADDEAERRPGATSRTNAPGAANEVGQRAREEHARSGRPEIAERPARRRRRRRR